MVNKVANDSVAGNTIRVITKHPGRKVDTRGAHNHEISSIPLVTSVEVTPTTAGEIILIMHQHACHRNNNDIHSSVQI